MGSDFTYEDLSGRDLKSDNYELIGEDVVHGSECYKINAIPIDKKTQYGSRMIWVEKENYLMKKVEFYNKKGKQIKILDIPNHVKNGDYWMATKLTMHNIQKSHKTVLEVLKFNYDQGLNDNIFTESYLKRR